MSEEMTTLSLRLPKEEKEALAQYAQAHDLSMSQVIRKAVKSLLTAEEE
jgi:predicted transcriptional regulator